MTIGQRIKQRRKELGLTQTDLAHRLGNKSKVSVCTVENDKEDLTTDRIRKYAKALECTPAYLMGWEDAETDKQSPQYDYLITLNEEEYIILECYRQSGDMEKEFIKRMVDYDDIKKKLIDKDDK